MTSAGFDEERLEAMERYVDDLEFQLSIIYGRQFLEQSQEQDAK